MTKPIHRLPYQEGGGMKGIIGEISGMPIFEDINVPEGTYIGLDKDNLPTRDMKKVTKIVVHNLETFKISMENNLSTPLKEK